MSNTNTGGPAFPVEQHDKDGMTLRDYFAAKVLQGICASGPTHEWTNSRLAAAKFSYEMADTMLKAREA